MNEDKTYYIIYQIKTDYYINELEEVLSKLFNIPKYQYDDCNCFEYQKELIIKAKE